MDIQFYENKVPTKEALVALYSSVGWGHKDYPEMLDRACRCAHFLVTAYYKDELIGLGRTISDGAFTVYFPDLLIHPSWQSKKIGTQIMEKLLLKYKDFHNQVLLAEDEKAREFYLKNGFALERSALSITRPFKGI